MESKPQPHRPGNKPVTAIGAAEPYPVVLVETSGALGALFAQRRCPGEILEEVLYFRILMDEPYAIFLPSVELHTIDGYSVAFSHREKALFYEPSTVPYAIRNISGSRYGEFVDQIVTHNVKWVEKKLIELFADYPGFGLDSEGKLVAPENYACGFEHFIDSHPFMEPHEARKN